MAVGQDDPNIANNRWISDVLWNKAIWHSLRIWDGWAHDWPYWQKMIQLYIGGHD
jgi:esterase/lipase superfamily enzyme